MAHYILLHKKIFLFLLILFVLLFCLTPYISLSQIAKNETFGVNSNKEKAIIIANLFKKKYDFPTKESDGFLYTIYSIFNQNFIVSFWTNHVDCVGASDVFVYMMQSVGITTRRVGTNGETHFWAEFYDGNEWLNIDPFNDSSGHSIGDLNFYSSWDQPFGKRFSFVYYEDENGTHDITKKYRETGTIKIFNFENGKSSKSFVIVKSHHLMEVSDKYKEPFVSFSSYTDKNGFFEHDFGYGNNYTIELLTGFPEFAPVLIFSKEKKIYLDKNKTIEVRFDEPMHFKGLNDFIVAPFLGAIILTAVIIGMKIGKKINKFC